MQYGFYFDQNRCTGCFTCVVACHDWHDTPAGPASWCRLKTTEKGKYPDLFVSHLFMACYHCLNPACIAVCPSGAVTKRDQDGIVVVDREACLGKDACGQCFDSCTYGAPQFGPEEDAKMQKCNLCIDRWAKGDRPTCVQACPTRALDAGPMDDLRTTYGKVESTDGFSYLTELMPSIVFKPKEDARNLATQKVRIKPDAEAA